MFKRPPWAEPSASIPPPSRPWCGSSAVGEDQRASCLSGQPQGRHRRSEGKKRVTTTMCSARTGPLAVTIRPVTTRPSLAALAIVLAPALAYDQRAAGDVRPGAAPEGRSCIRAASSDRRAAPDGPCPAPEKD